MNQPHGYVTDRVLNNNVAIVFAEDKEEYIIVGKGIGFGTKKGTWVDSQDPRIEKRFSLIHPENQEHFKQLFSMVPKEVVGVAEEIILMATQVLQCTLHEHIHVALADHIGFSLARLQGGITIDNPFLAEIQTLYPKAWRVAAAGGKLIEERFSVPIPDEEVGFLTLHIHSATHTQGVSETVRVADSINLAIRAIEQETGQEVPKDQLNYARMVIHLRFAIQRIQRGEPIANPLSDAIVERLPRSYAVAERVAAVISKRIGSNFPTDEISYLAMHIARLTPLVQESE